MGFHSNIGFHNKNPLYYTAFHVDQQMIIYVLHTTEELDCINNCTVIKLWEMSHAVDDKVANITSSTFKWTLYCCGQPFLLVLLMSQM